MLEDFGSFNTRHPDYKKFRQAFNDGNKSEQDKYTNKLDAIAEKKAKRLLAES